VSPLDRDGAYYPPTVLADVPQGCPVDAEEVFGPVAAVYRVSDEEAAIEKANDTGSVSEPVSGRMTSIAASGSLAGSTLAARMSTNW